MLGLLSSDFAGERAEAGRKADLLVRQSGLTWADVLLPVAPELSAREIETIEDALDLCQSYADRLTRLERQFTASLARQRSAVSDKQMKILLQILAKCRDDAMAT